LKLLAFSSPEPLDPEFERREVLAMFDSGLECFHLRKPKASQEDLERWIEGIPEEHQSKIVLHSAHDLAKKFPVRGIHLSARQRSGCLQTARVVKQLKREREDLELSSSYYQLSELRFLPPKYDYVFLSPIFPSISSPDSQPPFSLREVETTVRHARSNIFALGGIDKSRVETVRSLGFQGVALLGALWESEHPAEVFRSVKQAIDSTTDDTAI